MDSNDENEHKLGTHRFARSTESYPIRPLDHDLNRLTEPAVILARAMHEDLVIQMHYWKSKGMRR